MIHEELLKLAAHNLPVVELEGEKFWLTIPPLSLIKELALDINRKEIYVPLFDLGEDFFVYDYTPDGLEYSRWLGCSDITDLAGGQNSSGGGLQVMYYKTSHFRPILIPLTDGGIPDIAFSEENPDGSVFQGGYLMAHHDVICNDKKPYVCRGYLPDAFAPLTMSSYGDVQLVDEVPEGIQAWKQHSCSPEPLKWFAYHGCLICLNCCYKLSLYTLWDWDLVPKVGKAPYSTMQQKTPSGKTEK